MRHIKPVSAPRTAQGTGLENLVFLLDVAIAILSVITRFKGI